MKGRPDERAPAPGWPVPPLPRTRFAFLWRSALRKPWRVIVAAAVVVPLLAAQARSLRFERRIDLLSPDDPVSLAERRRHAVFGDDLRLLVALEQPYREG